ncbi:vesicle transport protein USE1 [Stomoxys calcitrans]|uniref:Vesicle transport protein USE1 n=1 Tax=Stomoxys calcitrans TaxID=35570 RepID=A0A1I8NX51_STOCA|nr:vesicle transport protein USE1 [Stomoxys calcitrans]
MLLSNSSTKLNVNIRTLLANCEELAKDETNFWRLKKFIKSLDTMIEELGNMADPHSGDKIHEYTERLQQLKMLTHYIDSPPASRAKRAKDAGDTGDAVLKEMNQLNQSKQYVELRKELLQEDSLRRRKPLEESSGDQSEAVKFIRDNQEKITEHMLSLTRNLKEQTETANKIIKKDTEMMSRSAGMTDRNISALNKETEKLEDHSRNAWKCWMWLMIIFVIVTFIAMVLFMKIVKKKKY